MDDQQTAQEAAAMADKLVRKALKDHPENSPLPLKQAAVTRACTFLGYVFGEDVTDGDTDDDDGSDAGDDVDGDADKEKQNTRKKRRYLGKLDPAILVALGVLFQLHPIKQCAVPTIKALCDRAPTFIPKTSWYQSQQLWKASLGVVNSTEGYWRFRKAAVDAIVGQAAPQPLALAASRELDGQPRPNPHASAQSPTVQTLPSPDPGLLLAVKRFVGDLAELGWGPLLEPAFEPTRLARNKRKQSETDVLEAPVSDPIAAAPQPNQPGLTQALASRPYSTESRGPHLGPAVFPPAQFTSTPEEPPAKRQNIPGRELFGGVSRVLPDPRCPAKHQPNTAILPSLSSIFSEQPANPGNTSLEAAPRTAPPPTETFDVCQCLIRPEKPSQLSGERVTGWSEEQILDAVREKVGKDLTQEERSELKFVMTDIYEPSYIAVVVDFDGPSGIVIVDEEWLTTGDGTKKGAYLYITSRTVATEGSAVRYIRQAQSSSAS